MQLCSTKPGERRDPQVQRNVIEPCHHQSSDGTTVCYCPCTCQNQVYVKPSGKLLGYRILQRVQKAEALPKFVTYVLGLSRETNHPLAQALEPGDYCEDIIGRCLWRLGDISTSGALV